MRGRGRGPQHAATQGLRAAAAEAAPKKPKTAESPAIALARALGAKTTRLASLRRVLEGGLTPREVMTVAAAALWLAVDADEMEGAVAKRHVQIGKYLELLARLAEADKDRAPRDVRLHVTVGGAGAEDSAGNGPVKREAFLAAARARGFEFDPAVKAAAEAAAREAE